jgi:glycogen debranching enzyme
MRNLLIPTFCLIFATAAPAQVRDSTGAIPRFRFEYSGLAAAGVARAGVYVGDQGRRAAVLGDESGSFEVWTWPLKLVRDLRLAFKIAEYDQPIEGGTVARQVVARPEGVTIVYSHATFTVRQHVFVPLDEPGAIILLEVESAQPLDVLVRMHADFNLAWPGSMGGGYITWQPEQKRFLLSQGGVRNYNGFIGSPFATSGTSHPAHDAPTVPSQFVLHFDEGTAASSFIPIVAAGGAAPRDSVNAVYERLLRDAPRYWREKVVHYRRVSNELLTVETPDARINQMLEWSKVNLDQQLVCNPDLGCGLVAGFGRAGPGNFRPGFGWYFGGDAAINSLAMDALGQFDLVRQGLQFLAQYQREDGKIAHEISHAAKRLPWFTDYPYTWFHGDTTPFWMLACYEYWLASGDDAFLRAQWPNIVRAFGWSAATDANGDGLMENPAAGAGAVEVGGLGEGLLTDIYLAGVWTAALEGVAQMASAMEDGPTRTRAAQLAAKAQHTLDNAFWLEAPGIYAFALLQPDASKTARLNDALTVWPATAMAFGLLDAPRAGRMLKEIGSSAITADWGARMLSRAHPLYDPLHYNNGTVWPFVTGFAALAHYRYHRGWAGFDLVRDVARASFDFARGRTPELMSGAFYQALDTSVPQQFFATSMFVSPFVRGTIGWSADAPHNAAALEPHLPAEWSSLKIENLRVGRDRVEATLTREPGVYAVHLRRLTPGAVLRLRVAPALPLGARLERVVVDDRDLAVQAEESAHDVHGVAEITLVRDAQVEFHYSGGLEVMTPLEQVDVGAASRELKVLDFTREARDYVLIVEGVAATTYQLQLRSAARLRTVAGADAFDQTEERVNICVTMPTGSGFVRKTLRVR